VEWNSYGWKNIVRNGIHTHLINASSKGQLNLTRPSHISPCGIRGARIWAHTFQGFLLNLVAFDLVKALYCGSAYHTVPWGAKCTGLLIAFSIPVVTWRSTIWLNFIWRLGILAAIVFRASLARRSISLFFSSSVAYFLLNRLRYFSSFWDLWYSYWYCSSRCWSCSLQLLLEVRILPDCLCFHLIGRCHRQRQYYISECSVIESHK
jgi:hypothetical protein